MRNLIAKWRERRRSKHLSGWDSPVTGTDLLKAMLDSDKRRREPLP